MAYNGDCTCKNPSSSSSKRQPISPTDDDDDIFSTTEDAIIPQNDIIRTHHKQGYVDGITHAKESALQSGFDDAFPHGASLGSAVGRILSRLVLDQELFDAAKKELGILNVLSQAYFDEDLNLRSSSSSSSSSSSHELINKWEQIVYKN
ncbi:Uncharacterized protein YAE1 [Candida viswanathii]|uniref:Protein YAE1 n=1 Tax=Candida viswanathii TaxID=5486 RepID=A0A367YJ44_9ASCO|nr:Uncharacterized protein YAE1 [Candida viswanathii]